MDRIYSQEIKEIVDFFIGKEIEKTKFEGLDTLFIVGNQDSKLIKEKISEANKKYPNTMNTGIIQHLYFAANHSYDTFDSFSQLHHFLGLGYKVTYETTNDRINEGLINALPVRDDNFLLMISVVISPLEQLLKNAVIKIDDTDTNRKNLGVHCIPLQDIIHRDNITLWDEYGSDIVLS